MGIVLQDCRCYRPAGEMVVEEHRRRSHEQTPPLPLLERCALTFPTAQGQVEVEALLDTGTDITIFKKEKFREIEKRLPRSTRIPIRRISFSGTLTPAYPLTFVLPGGTSYISQYGFIRPNDWPFDVGDVWLGQDILNQLVVTFNGPAQTVTIEDPNTP